MINEQLQKLLEDDGYEIIRELPNGKIIALKAMLYTVGLFVGLDPTSYTGRYCYESFDEALDAIQKWDGNGDPAGRWVKYKGEGGERRNPLLQPPTENTDVN